MMTLACLGLFPAETAVKWSLGLLAAPAVVYGLNSAAGAWRREVKPIHKGPGGDSNDLLTEVASTEYE
jgi:hypothetical protein